MESILIQVYETSTSLEQTFVNLKRLDYLETVTVSCSTKIAKIAKDKLLPNIEKK